MNRRSVVSLLVITLAVFATVPAFADAAATYKAKCAMCHGPDGAGQTAMGKSLKLRDLRSDDVQKQSGEDLEKIISSGKGKMPAYKGKLPEAEIDGLVKFIKDMGKKK
jgi:cytochrome c6